MILTPRLGTTGLTFLFIVSDIPDDPTVKPNNEFNPKTSLATA